MKLKEIVMRNQIGIILMILCLLMCALVGLHFYTVTQKTGSYGENIEQPHSNDLIYDEAYNATGDKKISLQVTDAIQNAAEKESIDPLFLAAVIKQESNFCPKSASSSGSIGLMMISKEAEKNVGLDRSKITENVEIGSKILRHYLDTETSTDKETALKISLIGFYCGENGVKIYNQNSDQIDPEVMVRVKNVMKNYKQLSVRM